MGNKRILYISFVYPPMHTIGSIRASKHTKYLYRNGWIPYVIAGEPYSGATTFIEEEIPSHLIHNIPFLDPAIYLSLIKRFPLLHSKSKGQVLVDNKGNMSKTIFMKKNLGRLMTYLFPLSHTRMPNREFTWAKPALRVAREITRRKRIDLIYSSSSPPTSAIVASRIQRETGIPWIAEFRDLWSRNHFDRRSRYFSCFEEMYERKILRNASALVTVSQPLKDELIYLHKKPVYLIYNGFDEEDFQKEVPLSQSFTITYTGIIYGGRRDPSPLFQAINILKNRDAMLIKNMQVKFFGKDCGDIVYSLAEKFGVREHVRCCGHVDYESAIEAQKSSSLLLLLEINDPAAKGVLTGKLFEYLGAGRPILAVGCSEIVGDLLQRTRAGVSLNDPQEIARFLEESIGEYYSGNLNFTPDKAEIAKYTRRSQAENLISIFNRYLS